MDHSARQIGSLPGLKRYLRNVGWLSAERALRLLLTFVVGIYLARYLGVEHFGLYSYVLAVWGMAAAVAKLGVDEILIKDLAAGEPRAFSLTLGSAFWLQVVSSVLTIALICGIAAYSDGNEGLLLTVAALGLFFQPLQTIDAYFRARVAGKYSSCAGAIQVLISSGLKLAMIYLGADLIWFIAVVALDSVLLGFSLLALYLNRGLPSFFRAFNLRTAIGIVSRSWHLVLAGLAITLYMRIDQVMLKALIGEYDTGLYSAAVRVSEAVNVIPLVVVGALFPALVNSSKENSEKFREQALVLFEVLFVASLVVAVLLSFYAPEVIVLLYGSAFVGSSDILAIHVWSIPFVFLGVASGRWLVAKDLTRFLMLRSIAGAVLNVGMNLFLIPRYGAAGAAIATVVSFACAAVLIHVFSRKTRECFFLQCRAIGLPCCASIRQLRLAVRS